MDIGQNAKVIKEYAEVNNSIYDLRSQLPNSTPKVTDTLPVACLTLQR